MSVGIVERIRRWRNADGPSGAADVVTTGRVRGFVSASTMGALPSPVWTAADYKFEAELKRRLGAIYLGFTGQGYANRYGGGFVPRPGNSKPSTYILHHTAGSQSDTGAELWRYHVQTRGWNTDGYGIVVRTNGAVELVIPPSMMSYGAAQFNPSTVHVSVPGNYVSQTPAPAVLASVYQIFLALDACYGDHPWKGHGEIMPTACPGRLLGHLTAMRGASYGAATPPKQSYP